jgi:hypothetical protein
MARRQTTQAKVARLKALRDEAYPPATLAELKNALVRQKGEPFLIKAL